MRLYLAALLPFLFIMHPFLLESEGPFVKIDELQETGPIKSSALYVCVVVQIGGRYHLERKEQRPGATGNEVSMFDGQLTPLQQSALRESIEAAKRAPGYLTAPLPVSTSNFTRFRSKFRQNELIREVGYWKFPLSSPAGNAFPEDMKSQWDQSKQALGPVQSWLHDLEAHLPFPAANSESSCEDNFS